MGFDSSVFRQQQNKYWIVFQGIFFNMDLTNKSQPTWFMKTIQIDNLAELQEEFMPILYEQIPDFETELGQFVNVPRHKIEPYAPKYIKFLESLGLFDLWIHTAIITTHGDQECDNVPIHVDSTEWQTRSYGLNFPLVNCENTWTVWYAAEITTEEYINPFDKFDPRNTARPIKTNAPFTELFRYEVTQPAWINIAIPHRPVSAHKKTRALVSTRFTPELHNLLYY
jgi:hypothetical protein